MVLSKRLALSSITAVIIGLIIILTPAFLFPTQVDMVEYSALESPAGVEIGPREIPPEKAEPSLSIKTAPAYTMDIAFPSKEGYVSIRGGESVKLPLTVRSWVNEPITVNLRLVSRTGEPLPEFITYETEGPINIQPYNAVQTYITISVSENGDLGEHSIAVTGDLYQPIEGYSEIILGFILEVS